MNVITRQTVLPGRSLTLCARHDSDDAAVMALGLPRTIGAPQHSWHEGECQACAEELASRRADADERAGVRTIQVWRDEDAWIVSSRARPSLAPDTESIHVCEGDARDAARELSVREGWAIDEEEV